MDAIHDLGGKQGFGPIVREDAEPAFRERWEAQVFAIVAAAGAAGAMRNTDQFRHAIERIDPVAYLSHGYYGRWLGGVETLLREAGIVDEQALRAAIARLGGDPDAPAAARPARVPELIGYGPAAPGNQRPLAAPPRFEIGNVVRTTSWTTTGHTRLPCYARGRQGIIAARHDGWVFPDTNAHGAGENPQHLYTVVFSGVELWGPEAEPGVQVSLDLFEPYLEMLP
jgi:nitrile hydratase subunit beta